jgi:hypothetical protein
MRKFGVILLLVLVFTACGPNSQRNRKDKSSGRIPEITASLPYENFESYRGILTQTPWPSEGGWQVSPYGNIVDAGVDRIVKYEGNYSLRMTYRLGESGMIGLSRVYAPCLKWEGYDAVRLWLRPDGSGRNFTFFVMEKIGEDGIKWFWESPYKMTGTEPVIVTFPFSTFYLENNTKGKDAKKPFDWREIEETCFWVRRGSGEQNPEVPSTIWVDDVKVVKLAHPLDKVIAEPASPVLRLSEDGTIRIDYGSEADWTDAFGHKWRADIPAREGKLATSPTMPVAGTTLPDLYRNERRDVKKLSIPVPPGRYTVSLHFAETSLDNTSPGKRVFSINTEGNVIKDFDIWTSTGGTNIAHVESITVDVRDGELTVTFLPKQGLTTIAALEILPPGTEAAGIISWNKRPGLVAGKQDIPVNNVLENFESFQDDQALCAITEPINDGMMPTLALDPGSRCDGLNGLRFDYVFGRQPFCGFLWRRKIPVQGSKGLKFWIRPDGSGHILRIFFDDRHAWSYTFRLTDTKPRMVEIPWEEVFHGGKLPGPLEVIGIQVDQQGIASAGTLYFDGFELMDSIKK